MSESNTSNRSRNRRRDPRTMARFVEELSWLLSSYDDLDFRSLQDITKRISTLSSERLSPEANRSIERYSPKNPNISFLVGALPSLFNDQRLFATNEEISEFATSALRVKIPRWQKKSKFELIGHIVCNTAKLDDEQLAVLVKALSKLTENEKQARLVASDRKKGSSWNEVIQRLLKE